MVRAGNVIKGHFWNEPVKVEKIEEIGDYIRIVGSTIHSRQYVNTVMKKEEADELEHQLFQSQKPRTKFISGFNSKR